MVYWWGTIDSRAVTNKCGAKWVLDLVSTAVVLNVLMEMMSTDDFGAVDNDSTALQNSTNYVASWDYILT